MFKNYIKSTIRNIKRDPFISFVNIFGLTVGFTCCLVILCYLINELSYDRSNKNADNIYRVTRIFYSSPGVESLHLASVAPPFGPLLQSQFPGVKKMTRVLPNGTTALRYENKIFNEKNSFFADNNFLDFFNTDVLKGNAKTALTEPYSVMITDAVAHKYFGDQSPIDKTIILENNKRGFKVTGVFKPFPSNSHLHPDILLSFNTLKDSTIYGEKQLQTNYGNNSFYTYLLMPQNFDPGKAKTQMENFLDDYVHFNRSSGNTKTHQLTSLQFQKLTDIHLRSHLDSEIEENGDVSRVYIFSAIALFILLIACINYMNLSTARSTLRAKEIGVRKAIGAQRNEIISQFLSESVLISCTSVIFSLVLAALLLPLIAKISGQDLALSSLLSYKVLIPVCVLPIVIGLISGLYPALFMSSFSPAKVLKGMLKVGSGNVSFRKILVITQFSISIILIFATTVVYQQLKFIQSKNLGLNKDHILTIDYDQNLAKQYDAFKADLLTNHLVKNIARSSRIPSERLLDVDGTSIIQNGSLQSSAIELKYINADYQFIPTYGIKMAAGRNFSQEFGTDTSNYIINETAAREIGWQTPINALGKDIAYGGRAGKVIGVVRDFNFESFHQKIIPMIFLLPAKVGYNRVSIKIDGNNIESSISTIENIWHKYLPNTPFDFTFLDQKFDKLYKSETQEGNLFTLFSCIAMFIACLGLFGLSAFTISQRVKEIGVRKVLGASVPQIVVEISKDFLKLVVIAAVIALPIGWYGMNKWLADFAFRITISWWAFALAGFVSLLVAFLTISYQSVKAATVNPVKSLKSE